MVQKTASNKLQRNKSKPPVSIEETAFDNVLLEDLNTDSADTNFKSELEYDGYQTIEEYDNDMYSLNVDKKDISEKELSFKDREEELDTGEENLLDPQGNQK